MFFSFFVYSLAYNNFLSIHDVDAALQAVESLLAAAGDAPVEGVDHAGGRVVASLYRDVFNAGGMAVVFGAEERGLAPLSVTKESSMPKLVCPLNTCTVAENGFHLPVMPVW